MYICDPLTLVPLCDHKRNQQQQQLSVAQKLDDVLAVKIRICFIGLWYILHRGQYNTVQLLLFTAVIIYDNPCIQYSHLTLVITQDV